MNTSNEIVIKVLGKGYHTNTILSWIEYIKNEIEEYSCKKVKIEYIETDENDDIPIIYVNNNLVFEGLPDNEGVLLELILHKLNELKLLC